MTKPSSLDDPATAAHAWARYRRMMKWMAGVALVCVVLALAYLGLGDGRLNLPTVLATIGGVGLSVLLTAALMGLVFLSSGTGHDESIEDPFKDLNQAHDD